MLNLRTGLLLTALLLCACDHHKKPDESQSAAVGQSDAALTGEPATNAPPYPRALPVVETNVPTAPGVAAKTVSAPPPDTSAPSSAQTPEVASSPPPAAAASTDTTSAPTPPAASPAASSTSAPASDNGSDMPRLALNTPNPVAASTPSPATAEEQVVLIDTSLGRIVIETDDDAAPRTSENFRKLAADGFYNHTIFHRVIPHFIIQGGDPNSLSSDRSIQGKGGPGYTLPAEIKLTHVRGAVAMARLPDSVNPARESNGSQFYICVADSPSLDDQYTVFGHVIKGMDVVDAISNEPRDSHDNPINRIEMEVTLEPKEQALSDSSTASH